MATPPEMATTLDTLNRDLGLLRRFEDHLANSPVVVTEWDKDFRLLYWSAGAERVFGWRAAEVLGKNPYEMGFIHPEDVPHVKGLIQRMTSAHERRSVSSNRNYDKFGNVHHCEWYNSSLLDENGEVRTILCIALDVTDRFTTEQALRASDDRLHLAQVAARAGVWDWDLTSGELLWTPEYYELFGLDPRATPPSVENFLATVHGDDRPGVSRALSDAIAYQSDIDLEFRIQRQSGEIRWFSSKGRIYRGAEQQPARMVGITIDVTEHMQLVTEVRAREERLRLAQRAARMGSWKWDILAGKIEVDEDLWALFGVEGETLRPDFHRWMQRIHPDDRGQFELQLRQAVETRRELNAEFRAVWPDGSVHFLRSLGRCAYNAAGKPLYMIGINMDVTERRRSEEQLRLHDQLAASGRMAASLAHEINNPLAAVTNVLYLLGKQDLTETARGYVELANAELERVAGITRNILGLYRDTPSPVRVRLSEVMNNVLLLYAPMMRAQQIKLISDYGNTDSVMGFPGELRQLFSNLMSNAVESMEKSGTIKVRMHPSVNGATGEKGVRVMIADHGLGIRDDIREKIFEPFFTTKGERGTGLGLWISAEIVRKHGGSLRIRTATQGNTGTVMNVFLPARHRDPYPPVTGQ
jgi:PAS domain S-box-containing protein